MQCIWSLRRGEVSACAFLFLVLLPTMHAPPGGGWHLVLRRVQRQVQCLICFFRLSLPCMPHPPGVRDGIWCCGECRGKCSAAVRIFFLCGHLVAMENAWGSGSNARDLVGRCLDLRQAYKQLVPSSKTRVGIHSGGCQPWRLRRGCVFLWGRCTAFWLDQLCPCFQQSSKGP